MSKIIFKKKAQVYIVIAFSFIFMAALLFILSVPIVEQIKGMINIYNSFQALSNAESGLEIGLYKVIKEPTTITSTTIDLKDIEIEIKTTTQEIISTGKSGITQRTLFFAPR